LPNGSINDLLDVRYPINRFASLPLIPHIHPVVANPLKTTDHAGDIPLVFVFQIQFFKLIDVQGFYFHFLRHFSFLLTRILSIENISFLSIYLAA
jgi:hypothetical protein